MVTCLELANREFWAQWDQCEACPTRRISMKARGATGCEELQKSAEKDLVAHMLVKGSSQVPHVRKSPLGSHAAGVLQEWRGDPQPQL